MIPDRVRQFFSDDFFAPHGFCYFWLPEITWLHVASNLLIALAYFSIPAALWRFATKRPDMPFQKIFLLFATFITLCGLTHIFAIVVLWHPYYGIEGLVMLATGVVSAATAVLVWKILPSAMTLPSPTELQEINRRLSAFNAEIEEMVRLRTHELEKLNAELTLSRRHVEEASQAKSDFLANMSHEIRTPMNVILGVARIMQEGEPLSPRQMEYMKTLHTSANSMMELINDILDIAKIESGKLELEEKPFSVSGLLDEINMIFQFQAREKDLTFTKNVQCECVQKHTFMGDANRLRQVLINLCSNAIKFTHEGSVTIEVACEKMSDHGFEKVIFTVKDTGIGIPESKLDSIFEKFVQADTSITRKYGGSGLGLTITKFLVEAMGGFITVSSQHQQGTEFVVTIPMKIAEENQI